MKTLKVLIIVLLIITICYIFFNVGSYSISENGKKELLKLLEIEDSQSFKLIYIKHYKTGPHSNDPNYYGIKFEISIQDYEKNNLNYSENEFYTSLSDCTYKEKKDDNTYICIYQRSDIYNKSIYDQIHHIKNLK